MKIRTLVLVGLFLLPGLGLVIGSPTEERDVYRASGRTPVEARSATARTLPVPATGEGALVMRVHNVPPLGPGRFFSVDGNEEAYVPPGSVAYVLTSPGVHEISQDASAEWILDRIDCSDELADIDVANARAEVQVDSGGLVQCLFTNKAPSTLFHSGFERGETSKWGETPPAYCAGSCGNAAPAGCFCDSACVANGDCCPDVCLTCGVCG